MQSVGTVIGSIGRDLWWWLAGAARIWWVYTIRSTVWLITLMWQWWHHRTGIVLALLVPVVAVAVWARLSPSSYRRRLADPLWRYRTKRNLKRSWPLIMETAGLARRTPAVTRAARIPGQPAAAPAELIEVPRRGRIRWVDGQLVATPRLLTGQTLEDVEAAAERLRVAMEAHRCRIVANTALTGCQIVWSFGDPLAEPFDAIMPRPDDAPGQLGYLRLGRTEDGRWWTLTLGLSLLVAGASGSGKGSLVWSIVFALGPNIKTGLVQVHGIDLKGGMEFAMGAAMFTRYAATPDQAVVLLEDAARNLQARAARLAGHTRQHTPTREEPLVVVLVDELAALIAYFPDRDLIRRAEAALSVILSQGRAVGCLVFAFLQDPRKETVRMRHLFPQSLGLRLRDREEVAMVLGDGAVNAGASCHKISTDTPGLGFVLGPNNRPVRVRAGYVSDDMIRLAARRFPAPHQLPITIPEPATDRPRTASSRSSSRSPRSTATSGGVSS